MSIARALTCLPPLALAAAAALIPAGAARAQLDIEGVIRLWGVPALREAIEEGSRAPAPAPAPVVSAPSPQRQADLEMQQALAWFGWDVGVPDGVVGPRTRTAVAGYQALLGDAPNGEITAEQRTILAAAWRRGQVEVALVGQTAATQGMGVQGYLILERDALRGVAAAAVEATHGKLPLAMTPLPASDKAAG